MSVRVAAALAALLCGCTSPHDGPPGLPTVAPTSEPSQVAEVPAPTTPTPAFAPAKQGACTPDYQLREGVCVHATYAPDSQEAFTQAVANYKRGAVPPMLGPKQHSPAEPRARAPLGPGSLRKAAASDDAGMSAKERRLAELDTMIEAAREQLRQRDEAGKAKRVDGPAKKPAAVAAPTEAAPTTAFAGAAGTAAMPTNAAGEQALQARLNELSQLTNGMSTEQLKQLTTQLGGMGMDPARLDTVLKQAGASSDYSTQRR